MTEELDVHDSNVELRKYLVQNGYDKPQDIVIDYLELIKYEGLKLALDEKPFDKFAEFCLEELNHLRRAKYPEKERPYVEDDQTPYSVTLTNYPAEPTEIKNLYDGKINSLVNIDCAVRKAADTKKEMVYAAYNCAICDSPLRPIKTDRTMRIPMNLKCHRGCHQKFYLDPDRCLYRNIQYVVVQDLASDHGRQPRSIPVVVPGPFIDKLMPGNRCRITAQIKLLRDEKNISTIYLEAVNVVKSSDDYADITVTPEDIEEIKKLAAREDFRKMFADSIDPSVYGYEDVKMSLALQMFGGVSVPGDDDSRQRGDSHILLCGDPGMAKSQLIRSVRNIVPRAVYASGKSTSGAGLTAAAVKDELDGKWSIEAGALALANGGMAVIDELEKMREEDRSSLHEAMEQQTISVNKAGQSVELETACAVLAAANPIGGKFIDGQDLVKQIDLPPSLMSRFDLIFTMVDKPNKDTDDRIAEHVRANRRSRSSCEVNRPISIDMMRKILTYAKTIDPVITDEPWRLIKSRYISLRGDKDTYVTVRQLEALIRLTESAARMKLRSETTVEDAEIAINLFESAIKGATLTESVDMSHIYGMPNAKEASIETCIHGLLQDARLTQNEICREISIRHADIRESEVRARITKLKDEKKIAFKEENGQTVYYWVR